VVLSQSEVEGGGMLGWRRRHPEQHHSDEALVREVGAQLRQARIARGEELEDVAEYLRIRPTYLYGLEQGDLSVIPGRTYALGFLRSYAQYLGFDGEDLIAQIRSSVAGLTGSAHLHHRSPLAESRLPTLPIVVVSLAALAGIYAGWAYVDDRSRAELELVAEVPDDLKRQAGPPPEPVRAPAAIPDSPPQAAPPEITPAIAPAAEPAAAPAIEPAAAPELRPRAEPDEAAPSADLAAASASADRAGPPPQTAASESARPGPLEREQDDPSTATVTPERPAGADQAVLMQPQPPGTGQTTPDLPGRPAAEVLAALEPVAEGDVAPAIYATDDAATRVILRARTSAWVHVSSTNNDYLWVKTLRPGDAFAVPDRPDLVLWTGNAGGIEVIVDGTPLPPLGPEARVVRDVSLRPQDLLRRLAPAPASGAASEP
jgi:cytoskeleton protein RodZ